LARTTVSTVSGHARETVETVIRATVSTVSGHARETVETVGQGNGFNRFQADAANR